VFSLITMCLKMIEGGDGGGGVLVVVSGCMCVSHSRKSLFLSFPFAKELKPKTTPSLSLSLMLSRKVLLLSTT